MKTKIIIILCCILSSIDFVLPKSVIIDKQAIFKIMTQVADWQIADFANNLNRHEHKNWMWTNGVLFIGMERLARLDSTDRYYSWLDSIAAVEYYRPGPNLYFADDQAVIQLYIELYKKYKTEKMILPSKMQLEWVIRHPSSNDDLWITGRPNPFDRWSWCDALFMAPPAFAAMGNLLNDERYFEFIDREFAATQRCLFDSTESLFYRDHRYFDQREANGKRVFWGRGNGWVLAGISLLLEQLPNNYYTREAYITLFQKMAYRIISLQNKSGMWHPSLLDPNSYPIPESSASALIGFALAWGVNEGVLDREKYKPAIDRCWQALKRCVHSDGKLGFVQPIGADPKKVSYDQTEVYGVGAFLLFGYEMYRLVDS